MGGRNLISQYRAEGLRLQEAANAVEAGIFAVEQMMYGGRLKVFNSLSQWYSELRSYRRDQNGNVVNCMGAIW